MKKVVLIGSGGSGKSTLATRLGEAIDLPVWHLDQLLWKPGWVPVEREEVREIQRKLVTKEKWIIDGNYGSTMEFRMDAADTIIFLDLSRWRCSYRAMKRMFRYHGKSRPDMREGCEERLDLTFLKWIWQYPKEKRPGILQKLAAYSGEKTIIHLKSPREVRSFLENAKTYKEASA
ncbi:DNA topology modulation protein [Rossellomorea marisflavi]|uniref:DNA topology modulation protein n=1 Tax=Rossellomorea marisflavi TaxID=189381 RepID=UPI00203B1C16|nr:DNA topology modulation protein [Rossellomorea marisflavi]MCM2603177.1 DNA topology modulation protein [Rossellomorea marisflavi]